MLSDTIFTLIIMYALYDVPFSEVIHTHRDTHCEHTCTLSHFLLLMILSKKEGRKNGRRRWE